MRALICVDQLDLGNFLLHFTDGVAPRAKMNQQRSRRYLSVRDSDKKRERARSNSTSNANHSEASTTPPNSSYIKDNIKDGKLEDTAHSTVDEEQFDSNVISPGTQFMDMASTWLHQYARTRIQSDPAWSNVRHLRILHNH